MGFVTKTDIEKSFSEFSEKMNKSTTDAATRTTSTNNDGKHISLADVIAHFDDPNCARGNCPVHQKKEQIQEDTIISALDEGLI